ncbi:hypothetical protein F4679DRAFT_585261 [Xylaria curta]|nr:hypothetical protein F4679DRAFT_585261 [Xylaria curta]
MPKRSVVFGGIENSSMNKTPTTHTLLQSIPNYPDPHSRRLQVCPGGCNEGTGYINNDYDVNYGNAISSLSDEAVTAILHDRILANFKAMHPQRVPLIEIVATRMKWSTPIPAYFSVSKGGIMPHSSAVTLAHLALIQARDYVDKIEVDFQTHYQQGGKANQDTQSYLRNADNLFDKRADHPLTTGEAEPLSNSDELGSLFSKHGANQNKFLDTNTSSSNVNTPSNLFNRGSGRPFKASKAKQSRKSNDLGGLFSHTTTFSTNVLAPINPFDKATHHRQQGEEVIQDTRFNFQTHYQQNKTMNRDPHSDFLQIKAISAKRSITKRKLQESALYEPINIKRRKLANKAISDGFGGNSGGSIPRDKVSITAHSEELTQNTRPQFQNHHGQQNQEPNQDIGSGWWESLFRIVLEKKDLLMGWGLFESFLSSEY